MHSINSYKCTPLESQVMASVAYNSLEKWMKLCCRNFNIILKNDEVFWQLFLLVKLCLLLRRREMTVRKEWPAKVRFVLFFSPAFPPFSHAHPCACHSTFFNPSCSVRILARVWQVPGGESQSCRDDAPQWWARCGAGNPEAQEAGEAGRVAAGHVGRQRQVCSITEDELTWPQNILHLSETSQRYLFSHCRNLYTISFVKKKTNRDKENILMNLLICHRKGKNELVICLRVPPQMEFLPLFLTFLVVICPVWPGSARPGRPQLHVAAMPPLRVPFVSTKKKRKERKRSVLLFFCQFVRSRVSGQKTPSMRCVQTTRGAV